MEIRQNVIDLFNCLYKDTSECIEYHVINQSGYGNYQTRLNGKKKNYTMHRVAYQVYYNVDLVSDNIICHTCDNPKCFNPKHLKLGTHADNVRDRVLKGRSASGSKNGRYIDGRTKPRKKLQLVSSYTSQPGLINDRLVKY